MPVARAGEPPDVDVYIDDGRGGEYSYQPVYWNNPSVWNRTAADGGYAPGAGGRRHQFRLRSDQEPGYKDRPERPGPGFHRKPAGGTVWPDDFQPLATTELAAGTLAARGAEEKVVGPFAWVPTADAQGQDSLLLVVSADGDASNVDHVTAGEAIPEVAAGPQRQQPWAAQCRPRLWRERAAPLRVASRAAMETGAASAAEQLLQTLGFSGQEPKNVRIQGLTLQVELEDAYAPPGEAAPRLAAAARFVAAEASAAAEWGMRRHAAIATAAMERLRSARAARRSCVSSMRAAKLLWARQPGGRTGCARATVPTIPPPTAS